MNLNDFGLLIKTLRKSSVDQWGNPWTRESLSRAVHLSPDQLGRLERGDRKYLDTQTLLLLADSFNLTNLERKEFLYAALGLSDEQLFAREDSINQLNNLLHEIENLQVPVLLLDAYSDIVAANVSTLNLFLITPELLDYAKQIPAGQNLLNLVYSPAFGAREIFGSFWRKIATIEILLFRRSTLRYRHTAYFNYLMKVLLQEKQFDIDWYFCQRYADRYDLTYVHFLYEHPRYGPLSYLATETIISTKKGELYLLAYNPLDKTTASIFKNIKGDKENRIHRFASWPEKKVPIEHDNY